MFMVRKNTSNFIVLLLLMMFAQPIYAGFFPDDFEKIGISKIKIFAKNIAQTPSDFKKIKELASKTNQEASFANELLSIIYEAGYDGKPNGELYAKYLNRAAELGNKRAMFARALNYYIGMNEFTRDLPVALKLFEESAKKGSLESIIFLGNLYRTGLEVPKNVNKALEIYKIPGVENNMIVNYNIANIYYNGDGVDKNEELAIEFFKKAAKRGHKPSIDFLEILDISYL